MFTRLTIVQIKKDRIDEAIKLYEESVVPAAKSQRGHVGVHLLIDRKTGKGISITVWDAEVDSIANEQSGYYQEQVAKFKDMFAAPPVSEGYEVAVSE